MTHGRKNLKFKEEGLVYPRISTWLEAVVDGERWTTWQWCISVGGRTMWQRRPRRWINLI